jgi:hypothetical protein
MTSINSATPIFVSTTGIEWATTGLVNGTVSIDGTSLNSISYFNGMYVAVGDNIVSSNNPYVWIERYRYTGSVLYGVSGININNFSGFIAVGYRPDYSVIPTILQSSVLKSLDGITWTSRTSAADNGWFGITYGKGLFVAVAVTGTNRIMTSLFD